MRRKATDLKAANVAYSGWVAEVGFPLLLLQEIVMINEMALKAVSEEFFLTDSETEELLHLVEGKKVRQNTEQCDYDSNPQLGYTAHPPYTHLLMLQVVKRYFEILNGDKINHRG